jgi:CheY-like chemotaxis protein
MHSILIIEDDTFLADTMSELLELAGYSVKHAPNASEALDLLRLQPSPAIILLDLNMPVMNGWEFLARRCHNPALATVPVIAMSGSSTELPQGAAFFLRKPISVRSLLNVIKTYC